MRRWHGQGLASWIIGSTGYLTSSRKYRQQLQQIQHAAKPIHITSILFKDHKWPPGTKLIKAECRAIQHIYWYMQEEKLYVMAVSTADPKQRTVNYLGDLVRMVNKVLASFRWLDMHGKYDWSLESSTDLNNRSISSVTNNIIAFVGYRNKTGAAVSVGHIYAALRLQYPIEWILTRNGIHMFLLSQGYLYKSMSCKELCRDHQHDQKEMRLLDSEVCSWEGQQDPFCVPGWVIL